MRRGFLLPLVSLMCLAAECSVPECSSETSSKSSIAQGTIQDRLDRLRVDLPGKRLFIAALGDKQNTVEVVEPAHCRRRRPCRIQSETKYLYVGFGDAKSGGLAVIDTRTNEHIRDIKMHARPGGIKFDRSSPRIFVTFTGTDKLGVVDRKKASR